MTPSTKLDSNLNNALNTLIDKQSTKIAKSIAQQVFYNRGFTDKDITLCVKQRTLETLFILEAWNEQGNAECLDFVMSTLNTQGIVLFTS